MLITNTGVFEARARMRWGFISQMKLNRYLHTAKLDNDMKLSSIANIKTTLIAIENLTIIIKQVVILISGQHSSCGKI